MQLGARKRTTGQYEFPERRQFVFHLIDFAFQNPGTLTGYSH
jgi:hypothetical protein